LAARALEPETAVAKFVSFRSTAAGSLVFVVALGGLVLVPQGSSGVTLSHADPAVEAQAAALAQPAGLSPATVQTSYGLSASLYAGTGQTIAIVDAFDNANVASDLTQFDGSWNLPVCGVDCFAKVDQNGGTDYPSAAPLDWAVEIAMDVEWAHAIAPGAHILLVEAQNSTLPSLLAAEQYAGAHANYVSNSWGFPEFSGETADSSTFADAGVSYFAAVADTADKTQYPATDPNVVAVGGNELTPSGAIPWPSGGGGCSAYEPASSSETAVASQAGCSGSQPTPLVSGDATGIPVFDPATGWITTGGASFATVLWAAAAADSGQLVTNQAISSGLIPLTAVAGGTLLRSGFGTLGAIPMSFGESVNMDFAELAHSV
jgi:subtilase family serine protease